VYTCHPRTMCCHPWRKNTIHYLTPTHFNVNYIIFTDTPCCTLSLRYSWQCARKLACCGDMMPCYLVQVQWHFIKTPFFHYQSRQNNFSFNIYPDDWGRWFLWNIGSLLPHYMTPLPTGQQSLQHCRAPYIIFNSFKTDVYLNHTHKSSSCLTENIIHLHFKDQQLNSVYKNNTCSSWDS
jgi:hypothetical protein